MAGFTLIEYFFTYLNIKKLEIYFDREFNFVKEFKLRGVPTTIILNEKRYDIINIEK